MFIGKLLLKLNQHFISAHHDYSKRSIVVSFYRLADRGVAVFSNPVCQSFCMFFDLAVTKCTVNTGTQSSVERPRFFAFIPLFLPSDIMEVLSILFVKVQLISREIGHRPPPLRIEESIFVNTLCWQIQPSGPGSFFWPCK